MSKTALVTLSYLDGYDHNWNPRLARNIKYLNWYLPLKDELGFDSVVFIDNGSLPEHISALQMVGGADVQMIRFMDHLPRGNGYDYPYCWRGLYAYNKLINAGYTKLICVDSDYYILKESLTDYVKSLTSGWEAFYCPKYDFPEAAFHVLCQDAFPVFESFISVPWESRNGTLMERALPFTHVNKRFNCDRYGEIDAPQTPDMDAYGQCRNARELVFEPHANGKTESYGVL